MITSFDILITYVPIIVEIYDIIDLVLGPLSKITPKKSESIFKIQTGGIY